MTTAFTDGGLDFSFSQVSPVESVTVAPLHPVKIT